ENPTRSERAWAEDTSWRFGTTVIGPDGVSRGWGEAIRGRTEIPASTTARQAAVASVRRRRSGVREEGAGCPADSNCSRMRDRIASVTTRWDMISSYFRAKVIRLLQDLFQLNAASAQIGTDGGLFPAQDGRDLGGGAALMIEK